MDQLQVKDPIDEELHRLRCLLDHDFSAVAFLDKDSQRIRWNYVSGNTNERYKFIVQKPGRGLAGSVIRLGRPIIIDQSSAGLERARHEYPIMLAEKLWSAVAAPIHINGMIQGVLLVGSRTIREYSKQEIEEILLTMSQHISSTPMDPSL